MKEGYINMQSDWNGHMPDIPLCTALGRNTPDNGRAQMTLKSGKSGQVQSLDLSSDLTDLREAVDSIRRAGRIRWISH
jgi:hypothetical protein